MGLVAHLPRQRQHAVERDLVHRNRHFKFACDVANDAKIGSQRSKGPVGPVELMEWTDPALRIAPVKEEEQQRVLVLRRTWEFLFASARC